MYTMGAKSPVKILLVDDNPINHIIFHAHLRDNHDLQITAEAENTQQALDHLKKQDFDLIIMDYELKRDDLDGVDLTKIIRKQYGGQTKILFWSIRNSSTDVKNSIEAGANGYLLKEAYKEEVLSAITSVMSDGTPTPKTRIDFGELTDQEEEIMEFLAEGKTNREIAWILWIDDQIIDFYLENRIKINQIEVLNEDISNTRKEADLFKKEIRSSGYQFKKECPVRLEAQDLQSIQPSSIGDGMVQISAELDYWIEEQYENAKHCDSKGVTKDVIDNKLRKVERYCSNIMAKLKLSSRAELTEKAIARRCNTQD